MWVICSICHREDIETGFDVEVRKVKATALKVSKSPWLNLILCDDCYNRVDLTPHDTMGSSAGIEPAIDASEEQSALLD